MLFIQKIERNYNGKIVNIVLNDGQKVDPRGLYNILEQENVGGAYIDSDSKELHITCDSDSEGNLDTLSLI